MTDRGPSGWRSGDDVAGDLAQTLRWRLRSLVRPYARPLARATMGAIPFSWLMRARDRYARRLQQGGSVPVPRLIRACRFRLVPTSVETYSPPDRPDLRFVHASSSVVQTTFWFGMDPGGDSVEGAQIALWEQLCRDAGEIVEIGANVGSLTVPGGRATTAPYRAVEPHPTTAEVLRRNVDLNGLAHVEVVEAAAIPGTERGSVDLALPADDPWPTSTAAAVVSGADAASALAVRVEALPVRELVGDADLVKLDVEGMELTLLEDLAPWIVERGPTMMIEVLDNNLALKRWLAEFAGRHQVELQAVTVDGPRSLDPSALPTTSLSRRYGTRDVLVRPRGGRGPQTA